MQSKTNGDGRLNSALPAAPSRWIPAALGIVSRVMADDGHAIRIEAARLSASSRRVSMENQATRPHERKTGKEKADNPAPSSRKVTITAGGRMITATMDNNAAARDFLSRLPLTVVLNDYNHTAEKIFYPSPALTIQDVSRGHAPVAGDITIYIPWGNVAIFCKNGSYSNNLVKIGHIDAGGIDLLKTKGDIQVKFERQDNDRK